MKLSFSDKHIPSGSFLELCNIAHDYGFDGFEISDAELEKSLHNDSIFRETARQTPSVSWSTVILQFPF